VIEGEHRLGKLPRQERMDGIPATAAHDSVRTCAPPQKRTNK
jgi:hypothetical protein